jgi:hypothetical protein
MWILLLAALAACHTERDPLEGLPRAVRSQVGRTKPMSPCVVESLPTGVKRVLAEGTANLDMADPGQAWNSSDLGMRGVPRRLLVRAVYAGDTWVVDYYKGGFASSHRVAVIKAQGEEGRLIWGGTCHARDKARRRWRCAERN